MQHPWIDHIERQIADVAREASLMAMTAWADQVVTERASLAVPDDVETADDLQGYLCLAVSLARRWGVRLPLTSEPGIEIVAEMHGVERWDDYEAGLDAEYQPAGEGI